MSNSEDLSKLPKWAQMRIQKLEADVQYWHIKATSGEADSNTFVGYANDIRPLGCSPLIRFESGNRMFTAQIGSDAALTVRSESQLRIEPLVTNEVRIR